MFKNKYYGFVVQVKYFKFREFSTSFGQNLVQTEFKVRERGLTTPPPTHENFRITFFSIAVIPYNKILLSFPLCFCWVASQATREPDLANSFNVYFILFREKGELMAKNCPSFVTSICEYWRRGG